MLRTLLRHPPRPVSTRSLFSLSEFPSLLPFGGDGGGSDNVYHERKILPYSQRQLYDVVADVDSYRRFLPFCKQSRVLTRPPRTGDKTPYTVDAQLTVGFLAFEESYVSKVTCTPDEKVEAIGNSTLFKNLTTTWRFQPASSSSPHPCNHPPPTNPSATPSPGPTLMSIDLSYAFSSPVHATLASKVFGAVSKQMVEAFEKRCLEVYGPGQQ